MPVTYYGIGGERYEQIEEAWTAYFNELYDDIGQMTSEEYHDKYLIFVSGILSGMNIFSTRYTIMHKENGVPDGTAIKRALVSLTNDAVATAQEEYKQSGRAKR